MSKFQFEYSCKVSRNAVTFVQAHEIPQTGGVFQFGEHSLILAIVFPAYITQGLEPLSSL